MSAMRRAFSLLELVIVLGVIITLAALFLGISRAVLQAAERRELDTVYTQLYAALDAWQQANGREMTFQQIVDREANPDICFEGMPSADLYEENFNGPYIIVLFMDRLAQVEESREILSRISPKYLRPVLRNTVNPTNMPPIEGLPGNWNLEPGQPPIGTAENPNAMYRPNRPLTAQTEVVDPWGRRLSVVFPGRPLCRGELEQCASGSNLHDCADGSVRTGDESLFGSCRNRRPYFISGGPNERVESSPQDRAKSDDIFSYEPIPRPAP